jgi:hypothetical protein
MQCTHGKRPSACSVCSSCPWPHGKRRCRCTSCDGSSICQHGRDQYRCIACGGAGICAPAPHANASLAPLLPGLRNRHGLPRETKIGATLLAHSPASSQVALPPPLSPHIAVLSVVSQPFHLATAEACALCHVPCAVCPVLCASVPCALCAGALP